MDWYAAAVNPEPWAVGTATVGRRNGGLFATIAPDPTTASYKAALREALQPKAKKYEGPIRLVFYFFRQNISYVSNTGRKNHRNRPDLTNMQKATEDALQGLFFDNDREVVRIDSYLMMSESKNDGFIVIGIEESEIPPVDMHPDAMIAASLAQAEADIRGTSDHMVWRGPESEEDDDDQPF